MERELARRLCNRADFGYGAAEPVPSGAPVEQAGGRGGGREEPPGRRDPRPAWPGGPVGRLPVPALEASSFIGFVLPGEIAVLLGGVLAFKHRASQPAVIVAAVAGVIIVNPSVLLATLPVTAEHVARAYADEATAYLPHTDQPRTYPEPTRSRAPLEGLVSVAGAGVMSHGLFHFGRDLNGKCVDS
jgi:hypothetical protein